MSATTWKCGTHRISVAERALVMGVVNVTPDSFSDGGSNFSPDAAIEHGLRLAREGATLLDVGGESTRPGAAPVTSEEEIRRVVPVVQALASQSSCVVSVDTSKAAVAEAALASGASVVNDVTALTGDEQMAAVVRKHGAGCVLMHMRGTPRIMQDDPSYTDVVSVVRNYLAERIDALVALGVDRECLAIDPGIGFGKTLEHNLRLLASLNELVMLNVPVLVGVSRKSFIGAVLDREVDDRLAGSLAAAAYAIGRGAHVLRVHDVKETCDVARMTAILRSREDANEHVGLD